MGLGSNLGVHGQLAVYAPESVEGVSDEPVARGSPVSVQHERIASEGARRPKSPKAMNPGSLKSLTALLAATSLPMATASTSGAGFDLSRWTPHPDGPLADDPAFMHPLVEKYSNCYTYALNNPLAGWQEARRAR